MPVRESTEREGTPRTRGRGRVEPEMEAQGAKTRMERVAPRGTGAKPDDASETGASVVGEEGGQTDRRQRRQVP